MPEPLRSSGAQHGHGGSKQFDAWRELDKDITFAARTDGCVLITGATSLDAEVAARLIHQRSSRRQGPFVILNSAELSDATFELELLGDRRAPGAQQQNSLKKAEGGTIFVAGLGAISVAKQTVLLKLLDQISVGPLDSGRNQTRTGVRIIAATDTDLLPRVERKALSETLFYRLNVLHLIVPRDVTLGASPSLRRELVQARGTRNHVDPTA